MTDSNTKYYPLLPKTTGDFSGGPAAGQWNVKGVSLFNDLGDNLDFESSNYNEINSIPSPWSRALQFMSAMRNVNYPSREWLIAQYRGFLAAIALSENLKLPLRPIPLNLKNHQNTEFGRCLEKLKPSDQHNVLAIQSAQSNDEPWSQLYLFESEGTVLGFTSPATLVVPTSHLRNNPKLSQRIPWVKGNYFADPIGNGLTQKQKEILASWLQNLQTELLNNNSVNGELAGEVGIELQNFIEALGISVSSNEEEENNNNNNNNEEEENNNQNQFQLTENASWQALRQARVPLNVLIPAQAVKEDSNVLVEFSSGLDSGSKKPLKPIYYIIDPEKLPAETKRDARDIYVIGSSSLANFVPSDDEKQKGLFFKNDDFFTKELFYTRTEGLLPGTWLDSKLKAPNLTIFLPLKSMLKDYFRSSKDLKEKVELSYEKTSDGQEIITVTLKLKLSGFKDSEQNPKKVTVTATKPFPLKPENEIKKTFPTLALWPNVPPESQWKEYFVLVETSEDFGGLAFTIEQPTDKATQETRESRQESYKYWKCDRYPEILSAIDENAQFLGLLPLNIPKVQASSTGHWTVGVDFGTSFTNIYVRKGSGQPERFVLQTNLLKITKGLEEIDAKTYREFFIPDSFFPEGENPPISTVLTTRGWQETVGQIPHVISQARTYVPTSNLIKEDYIKTNIKWEKIEYQRPFLSQLIRWIAAQAAVENVRSIDWVVSYPSAFSRKEQNGYANSWRVLLEDLTRITGQTHKLADHKPIRTESIVFAQFFAHVLNKDLIHTTCVDMGGGTSDISIWQENELIHQSSVPYAGRDIFHRILQPNLAFIGDIFGFSPTDADAFRKNFSGKNNFNLALDIYLRFYAEEILRDKYVINIEKQRNREFRTLVAFALGGLYHYLGLVQKYGVADFKYNLYFLAITELLSNEYFRLFDCYFHTLIQQRQKHFINTSGIHLKRTADVTSILVGGNGSRFLHWLTITGKYNQRSEINILLDGILTKASGLKSSSEVMTLSTAPKDEACGGLVVPPNRDNGDKGDKLKGLDQDQDAYPFLGEACRINGQDFTADQRLKLEDSWENIEDFRVTSFKEVENYIKNFNDIIKDKKIQEIDPLRNFGKGGLFNLTDDLRTLLEKSVTQACLRKRGPIAEFEPEPPFIITLKCLVSFLAEQWSKTAN